MKNKLIYLFLTIIALCTQSSMLYSQNNVTEYEIGKNGYIYGIFPYGEDEFLLVYGKQLLSKQSPKNIMRFDKDLNPVWTQPTVFKGANIIEAYSYTNPVTKSTTSYIFGSEQFMQILPDGSSKTQKTLIPEKELEKTAAVFTDSIGLNIITLTGDKDYPTGSMKWYTFSHDQLAKNVKNITLAKPSDIDNNNESGWRLNSVSPSGLYFYYVSYKNETKNTTRPILACYISKVDYSGKTSVIATLDMNVTKYNVIASCHETKYPNLSVGLPGLYNTVSNQGQSNSTSYFPNDIAYLGLLINEKLNRIFTVYTTDDDYKTNNEGGQKSLTTTSIKNIELTVFDLTGKKINATSINHNLTKVASDIIQRQVTLFELPSNEGFICRAMNHSSGFNYIIDNKGSMLEKIKMEIFTYKTMMVEMSDDKFPADYLSFKDFKSSPYYLGLKSPVMKIFNTLEKQTKIYSIYISLKSGEIFLEYNPKDTMLKMHYFEKK